MTTISPGSDARARSPSWPPSTPHSISRPTIAGLDDDLRVVLRGGRDGGRQVGQVGHPGDAQAGPGARGLDEQRQPELGDARRDAVGVAVQLAREHHAERADGQAVAREHQLHHVLVHADRGREHPGADVPHVGQLEQALQRAVLAERAVQQREDDVDLAEHPRQLPGLEHLDVAVVDRLRQQHVRGGVLDLRQAPVGDRPALGVVVGEHPAAGGRDAHGEDVVAVAVDGAQHAAGGRAADRVLAGAAAEQDHHAGAAAGPGRSGRGLVVARGLGGGVHRARPYLAVTARLRAVRAHPWVSPPLRPRARHG